MRLLSRRSGAWLLFCLGGLVLGCAPATRYPAVKSSPSPGHPAAVSPQLNPNHAWLEPQPGFDVPIRFVAADTQPELWASLKQFWNSPTPGAGWPTAHLLQGPLGATVALLATEPFQEVRIKVPLGLPDPTPWIPPSNPPTLLAWRLGKKLFSDPSLLPHQHAASCATCHQPEEGFTERRVAASEPRAYNPPSLINCVYNQHQFWDGRVRALEEVLLRSLEDDRPPAETPRGDRLPDLQHSWYGVFQRVSRNDTYRLEFEAAYGVRQPTLDLIAKALATYLRTILSGNSIVDQARAEARKQKRTEPTAADFAATMKEEVLKSLNLPADALLKEAVAKSSQMLHRGHQLFHGTARCSQCHSGWNYTDGEFHNLGIRESDAIQEPGKEAGRFQRLPIGLKDARLIGAFRTPTLRALPRTWPYFHDGKRGTLRQVLEYYNNGVDARFNRYLDQRLRSAPGQPMRLNLTAEEMDALLLYLTALDGEPVAEVVVK